MKKIVLAILICTSLGTVAQETLITDRPDQTESPNAVGVGELQIESGLLFQRSQLSPQISEQRSVYPTNLFRIGLAKKLELRIVNEVVSYKIVNNATGEEVLSVSGTENLQLGFKYQISESDSRTIIGVMAHAILPTGSEGISNELSGIFSRINISHDLDDKRNISANFGYNNYEYSFDDGVQSSSDGEFSYTLVYGRGLTNKLGVYIESFGEYVEFEDWSNNMDAGMTYLINNNIQLDYSFGWGLNNVMNYHSVGISIRLQ